MALPQQVLAVEVHKAHSLKDTQTFGTQDPFVRIKLGSKTLKTNVHDDGGNTGVWNYSGNFSYKNEPFLTFEVWNDNVMADNLIGTVTVSLRNNVANGRQNASLYNLQLKKKGSSSIAGVLTVSYYFLTPADAASQGTSLLRQQIQQSSHSQTLGGSGTARAPHGQQAYAPFRQAGRVIPTNNANTNRVGIGFTNSYQSQRSAPNGFANVVYRHSHATQAAVALGANANVVRPAAPYGARASPRQATPSGFANVAYQNSNPTRVAAAFSASANAARPVVPYGVQASPNGASFNRQTGPVAPMQRATSAPGPQAPKPTLRRHFSNEDRSQIRNIIGNVDDDKADELLDQAGGDIGRAANYYFNNVGDTSPPPQPAARARSGTEERVTTKHSPELIAILQSIIGNDVPASKANTLLDQAGGDVGRAANFYFNNKPTTSTATTQRRGSFDETAALFAAEAAVARQNAEAPTVVAPVASTATVPAAPHASVAVVAASQAGPTPSAPQPSAPPSSASVPTASVRVASANVSARNTPAQPSPGIGAPSTYAGAQRYPVVVNAPVVQAGQQHLQYNAGARPNYYQPNPIHQQQNSIYSHFHPGMNNVRMPQTANPRHAAASHYGNPMPSPNVYRPQAPTSNPYAPPPAYNSVGRRGGW